MLKRFFNLDWVIVGLVFILLFLGLFVLKSIFPSLFIQQLIWAIFGIFAFLSLVVLIMNITKNCLGFFILLR